MSILFYNTKLLYFSKHANCRLTLDKRSSQVIQAGSQYHVDRGNQLICAASYITAGTNYKTCPTENQKYIERILFSGITVGEPQLIAKGEFLCREKW